MASSWGSGSKREIKALACSFTDSSVTSLSQDQGGSEGSAPASAALKGSGHNANSIHSCSRVTLAAVLRAGAGETKGDRVVEARLQGSLAVWDSTVSGSDHD